MAIYEQPVSKDRLSQGTTDGPAGLPRRVGTYRLEEELGKGGMGTVFGAFDEALERRVALKRIRAEVAGRPRARARFRREARTASRLDHLGIVKVHDIFTAEGSDWIVMERVDGERLDHLLRSRNLSLDRAVELAIEIAAALAAAHAAGVVHRDLKAANVFVTPEGHAKILDFGLAKQLLGSDGDSSISVAGQLIGTPHSMSPEQAMGHDVDLRSDLFSFGILLYQMLTGVCPFLDCNAVRTLKKICTHRPPSVCEIDSAIPRWLSRLVDLLLEKDPAHRPGTADEVATALRRGVLEPKREESIEESTAESTPTISFDRSLASRAIASQRVSPFLS